MAIHMEKVKLGLYFTPPTNNIFQVDQGSKCEKKDSMYIQENDFLTITQKKANLNRKGQYMHPCLKLKTSETKDKRKTKSQTRRYLQCT